MNYYDPFQVAGQCGASLPDAVQFLKAGITLDHLQALARALTDVQAAEELNEARQALFKRVLVRAS